MDTIVVLYDLGPIGNYPTAGSIGRTIPIVTFLCGDFERQADTEFCPIGGIFEVKYQGVRTLGGVFYRRRKANLNSDEPPHVEVDASAATYLMLKNTKTTRFPRTSGQ